MSMTISMTLPSTHIFRFACVITSFVWGSGTIFSASVYELATADVAVAKFGFFFTFACRWVHNMQCVFESALLLART